MNRTRSILAIAGTMLLVAACGGNAATNAPAQTQAAPTSATGQTPDAGPTQAPEATQAPAATQVPASTPGGGGTGNRACSLLTADEVAQASGMQDIVPQPVAASDTDAVSACGFVSMGAFPAVTVAILDPENTNTDPSGYLALPGSVDVGLSGAKGIWVPAAGNALFIIKGQTVATIIVGNAANDDLQGTAAALGQKVADRL